MYLPNRDEFNKVALYIKGEGVLQEIARSELDAKNIDSPGSYVNVGGKYFGAFGSSQGPIVFFENREFLLADENLNFEHVKGNKTHAFKVMLDGEMVYQIQYKEWDGIDFDVWSDEDSKDFFMWLMKAKHNPEFIKQWTI